MRVTIDPDTETKEGEMAPTNTTAPPLPEVKIGEREILANLIYPASQDPAAAEREGGGS